MTDPVFEGLALGLKPADFDLPPDTISVDLDLLKARERIRDVRATERLADLAEQNLAAQLRIANAAERQAVSFETLVALLAACVGLGTSSCAPDMLPGTWDIKNVAYLRTGNGRRSFGCDLEVETDDNESD